ncbi:hypothetical protein D918_05992 [Trichuris suis]|nr:hypothetical protein D918_05992 [Trichuris suis]
MQHPRHCCGHFSAVSSTSSNVPSSSRPEEEQAIDSDAGDAKHRQRRGAVSAEVYSEEDVKNYVKKARLDVIAN